MPRRWVRWEAAASLPALPQRTAADACFVAPVAEPAGDATVDKEVYEQLRATGKFQVRPPAGACGHETPPCWSPARLFHPSTLRRTHARQVMDAAADEAEHSLELHLPYIVHVMARQPGAWTLVPIVVGAVSPESGGW